MLTATQYYLAFEPADASVYYIVQEDTNLGLRRISGGMVMNILGFSLGLVADITVSPDGAYLYITVGVQWHHGTNMDATTCFSIGFMGLNATCNVQTYVPCSAVP